MDTVLSQVQSLGLRIKRIKSVDISDLRKTLSSRIVKLPFSKHCNVLLQKKGARHGRSDSGLLAFKVGGDTRQKLSQQTVEQLLTGNF